MMLYSLPCLLEEDNCRFQTIQLEFSQSKEILEMHMTLVHGRPKWRSRCNSCDRDTLVNDDKVKDIFDNDKRALFDKVEEASFGFTNELNMKDDPKDSKTEAVQNMEAAEVTSVIDDRDDVTEHKKDDSTVDYSITENEALKHSEVAEVTSIGDVRDEVIEHFNDEGYDKQEQRMSLLMRYSSQLEFYNLQHYAEIVESPITLQREELGESTVRLGIAIVEHVIKEDITEVFANQFRFHQEALILEN